MQLACPESPLKDKFARHVRREMLGKGFVLVDTSRLIDDIPLPPRTLQLEFHSKQWWKFPQLARYSLRLETLLRPSLPEESVSLAAVEFRVEAESFEEPSVDHLHIDGSYIRSVCTLYGPSTIYRHKKVEQSAPLKQTLLMTAIDRGRTLRIPCTLHRRPGPGPARAVIVCSFEPREDDLRRPNVFRNVATGTW